MDSNASMLGAPPADASGFTATLLADGAGGLTRDAARLAAGLGLSALYGLAMGARDGGPALLRHALGVPAAPLAVALVAGPALYIVLSLFDAPLEVREVREAITRGVVAMGLVLAGLAPAIALFAVTSGGRGGAAIVALTGLVAAGAVGLRALLRTAGHAFHRDGERDGGDTRVTTREAPSPGRTDSATHAMTRLVMVGFALFTIALSSRIWAATLPLLSALGGAR